MSQQLNLSELNLQYLITDIGMIDCLKVTSDRKMFLVVSYNSPFVCTEKKRLNKIAMIVGMIVK